MPMPPTPSPDWEAMRRQSVNMLGATWTTAAVVLFAIAIVLGGVTVEAICAAGETSTLAARRPRPPVTTIQRPPIFTDDPLPGVTLPPVDRNPYGVFKLDCAQQAHEQQRYPPFETVDVSFAQPMVTGGSAVVQGAQVIGPDGRPFDLRT
jgi:hypothetical protein